jgi:hypothetical protein
MQEAGAAAETAARGTKKVGPSAPSDAMSMELRPPRSCMAVAEHHEADNIWMDISTCYEYFSLKKMFKTTVTYVTKRQRLAIESQLPASRMAEQGHDLGGEPSDQLRFAATIGE